MSSTDATDTGRWWLVLCVYFVARVSLIGFSVAYLRLGFNDFVPGYVYRASFYGMLLLLPIGGVAFLFDREICKEQSE